jgi:transcriptional regulator with XRE-family HTH domain
MALRRIPSEFAALLAQVLAHKSLRRSEFAAMAGCTVSLVTEVLHGTRKPPLQRLEAWAALLFPEDAEGRLRFIRVGALLHAPPAIQAWVEELRRR